MGGAGHENRGFQRVLFLLSMGVQLRPWSLPCLPPVNAALVPLPPLVLSGVFTDVEASLKEIRALLDEDEAQEQKLQEGLGKLAPQQEPPPTTSSGLADVAKEWAKYMEVHEKASFTNTELHKAMNLHISNLRLLSGPLEQVRAALPSPSLTEGAARVLHCHSTWGEVGVGGGVSPLAAHVDKPCLCHRGQAGAAGPEADPGQGAGDAGPAGVPGAAAARDDPER